MNLKKYDMNIEIFIYGGSHVLLASLFLFLFCLQPREIPFLIILLSSTEKLAIYSKVFNDPYKSQIYLGIGIKIFLQSGFILLHPVVLLVYSDTSAIFKSFLSSENFEIIFKSIQVSYFHISYFHCKLKCILLCHPKK